MNAAVVFRPRLAEVARASGKSVSINQNMRFDQSMRVLLQLPDRGAPGEPVIETIEMRAIPHWQRFLQNYDLLNMSIHHLSVLPFMLGEPTPIHTEARPDPRASRTSCVPRGSSTASCGRMRLTGARDCLIRGHCCSFPCR